MIALTSGAVDWGARDFRFLVHVFRSLVAFQFLLMLCMLFADTAFAGDPCLREIQTYCSDTVRNPDPQQCMVANATVLDDRFEVPGEDLNLSFWTSRFGADARNQLEKKYQEEMENAHEDVAGQYPNPEYAPVSLCVAAYVKSLEDQLAKSSAPRIQRDAKGIAPPKGITEAPVQCVVGGPIPGLGPGTYLLNACQFQVLVTYCMSDGWGKCTLTNTGYGSNSDIIPVGAGHQVPGVDPQATIYWVACRYPDSALLAGFKVGKPYGYCKVPE
jgi:hypothetical protein